MEELENFTGYIENQNMEEIVEFTSNTMESTNKISENHSVSSDLGTKVVDTFKWGIDSVVGESISVTDMVVNETMRFIELATPYVITIISAILIYFVGKLIATIIRKLVNKFLVATKVDKMGEKAWINKFREVIGIEMPVSWVLSSIVYYVIYISVIIAVLEKLWFSIVTDIIKDLVAYIPNIFTALVILIFGSIVANFIKELVLRVSKTGGISYSELLSKIAYFLTMMFIVIVSVEQLKLNIDIITNNLTIIIWTICLLIAISSGFAIKNIVSNIVSSTYLKKSLKLGSKFELDWISGEIKEITSTNVVVKTSNGTVYIPSEKVLNNTFTVGK